MTDLRTAFQQQAETCGNMGSPFMERLLLCLSRSWPNETRLAEDCAQFTGDIGPRGHSLPLRIAGGLHALAIQGDAQLGAVYPPHMVSDTALEETVVEALHRHDRFLTDWNRSPPQTNEIRRSAVLIPGAYVATAHFNRPIYLSELGASGGLNLLWDHYALETPEGRLGPSEAVVTLRPDWTGPLPQGPKPVIADRRGVDLNPLSAGDADDLLRLKAYLWADQPARMAMTEAAAQLPQAEIDKGDAIDWLEKRLHSAPNGHLHVIQNTVAWQYFPTEAQARGTALIEAQGAQATPETPLAWLQLETDGDATGLVGGVVTLRLWPGDIRMTLGRADFHGRWVTWHSPEAQISSA